MSDINVSRRNMMIGAAIGGMAAQIPSVVTPANAKAEMSGVFIPVFSRYKLGNFEVTTLLAGQRTVPGDPQGTFAMNVDKEEFEEVSKTPLFTHGHGKILLHANGC